MLSGTPSVLLRQAGPALQQTLYRSLAAAVASLAQEQHVVTQQQHAQQRRQEQHPVQSRGLTTSAASHAPRFHENLKGPNTDPIFTRDNFKALKDANWSIDALQNFLQRTGARGASARRPHAHDAESVAAAHATRQIRDCRTLADLKAVVEERGHDFNAISLAAAVTRVPRITSPGREEAAERLLDRLVPPLLAAVSGEGQLGAREISNVLWALSKTGYPLDSSEVANLIESLLPHLGSAAAPELSMAAVAVARLAPDHDAFWTALEPAAAAVVRRAVVGVRKHSEEEDGGDDDKQQRRRRRRVAAQLLHTGPEALEMAANRDGNPVAAVAQAVANLAAAQARAGRAPAAFAAAASKWLDNGCGAAHLKPGEMAMVMWAAARWAGVSKQGGKAALTEGAVGRVLDEAAEKLWQFDGKELNSFLLSVARLGVQHPPLLAALAKHLDHSESAAGATPSTLATALSAAARAGSDGGRALLRATAAALHAAPGAFGAADAANAAWAAAAMGVQDEAFFATVLARLTACITDCGPRELTHALLGSCATCDGMLRADLIAAAAPVVARRAHEFSARDAAAVLRVLARSFRKGELAGKVGEEEMRGVAGALGDAVLVQWKAGGVARMEADDVARSLEVICRVSHPVVTALTAQPSSS